ncbi:MAG: hypothetical protein AVDCRST_MAG39-2145 [uncultured Sphingomonadaceae bacterium]|uniref:Aminoglycoside phosphotransferase domain-containing protein n=1 Tax=uncultured Sphingomonadaceae bacterium TaxID=169976 RepID=A0A6J4T4J5_9SPHN|nr:MAG: hypothetical protein AVDCRST_MAG39-2145 [uncultured Sphingomonadaceae bacterium]
MRALRSCDAASGPVSGSYNGGRGLPLTSRDAPVRAAIEALADEIDPGATCAAWNEALAAPCYAGPPSWLHGDLYGGNFLRDARRASGVMIGG